MGFGLALGEEVRKRRSGISMAPREIVPLRMRCASSSALRLFRALLRLCQIAHLALPLSSLIIGELRSGRGGERGR